MGIFPDFETKLYHGAIREIKKVDVTVGRDHKDFGKGFYMAVSMEQAIGMMHKKYREAAGRLDIGYGENRQRLYQITLNKPVLESLKIRYFPVADMEWLNFVLMCRESEGVPHDYDMVIGPTADDDTVACINTYNRGLYGEKGGEKAKATLLDNLFVDKLGVQYYIGKQNVADALIEDIREIEWRI